MTEVRRGAFLRHGGQGTDLEPRDYFAANECRGCDRERFAGFHVCLEEPEFSFGDEVIWPGKVAEEFLAF